jgi:hypothetical protein
MLLVPEQLVQKPFLRLFVWLQIMGQRCLLRRNRFD